jgi:tetratricopeptide (TPR) repeat protein
VEPDWEQLAARAGARHEDGLARLPEAGDERQRQLTRTGNAAWAAGLSYLMLGRVDEARGWLLRAADRYRESWPDAPAGSWGRPIGAMKARLIAGDLEGAREDARWALEAGAERSESPIGRYAAALARLVLGDDEDAAELARPLCSRDDFPAPVADALEALARRDEGAYETAIGALLRDFEQRDEFLEEVPVADTVLALQQLAAERGMAVYLASLLLPRGA